MSAQVCSKFKLTPISSYTHFDVYVIKRLTNQPKGNKPPWTLPAKAIYGAHDARRSIARFPGVVIQTPKDLMAVSKTIVVCVIGPLTPPLTHFLPHFLISSFPHLISSHSLSCHASPIYPASIFLESIELN